MQKTGLFFPVLSLLIGSLFRCIAMKVYQIRKRENEDWDFSSQDPDSGKSQLVFVMGPREVLEKPDWFDALKSAFPVANIVSLSTSGSIADLEVSDEDLVATALFFEKTKVLVGKTHINQNTSSKEAGRTLAQSLNASDLRHLLVLSEGLKVNGSELVSGINSAISIPVTGGLAGDAARFEKTLVGLNGPPEPGNIVGVGFYGDNIRIGYGYLGGWDPFGPERTVTRSDRNVLYELDNKPALELYKTYLGDKAKDLPGSGLLFPLGMKPRFQETSLTRTILSIADDGGMVFAGDLPEGSRVQLMKANFEKIIDASSAAAEQTLAITGTEPDFAMLISCVGRKLVLGQRVEEEVEAVRDVLGEKPVLAGFYSYGEISSLLDNPGCELHNQTMTITVMKEI